MQCQINNKKQNKKYGNSVIPVVDPLISELEALGHFLFWEAQCGLHLLCASIKTLQGELKLIVKLCLIALPFPTFSGGFPAC